MADQRVPQGRLSRFARMAAAGVRTGAGMLLERDGGGAAKQAAEILGTMRGLAAKMGQMASYVDGIVPEEQREAYESAMSKLRASAPTSSPEAIRATFERELGKSVDELFAEWSDTPVASASIGQVHRAKLHDGREVAVKVQHPGIDRAVESDLANASILQTMVDVAGGRRFDAKAAIQVVRERFREELDYSLEGQRVTEFGAMHAGDPTVRVPELVGSHSSRRVLTTTFANGIAFDEACRAPEGERRAWAETMWRFVFKGNLVHGKFNADPHPGNYVFHEDGKVTFLDYGCVQPIDPHRKHAARKAHGAAVVGDRETFGKAVGEMVHAGPGRLLDEAVAYTYECFRPLFESPFHITRPYAASLVTGMKDMVKVARKVEDHEFFTMPPDMVFINRLQFGFYSVLARLDVEVDYRTIEAAFLPKPGDP